MMDSTELTQFGLKQLFYQVKQRFPEVPDAVVNECLRRAGFDRQAVEALLLKEEPKYGRAGPARKAPQGPQKSSSAANSPVDSRARPLGSGSLTPTKVPPPLPDTPPVAVLTPSPGSGPSPPIYTSPLYRPDIDLSLPPPDATGGAQLQVFCEPRSSTSVNVILNPTTTDVPCVTYSSASTDHLRGLHSQLKITITPQRGTMSGVQRSSGLSPWNYGQVSPNPSLNMISQISPSLPDQAEHIREQCERRECLRRSLNEGRQNLASLEKRVEQLQVELTREKCLLGQQESVRPSPHQPPLYRQQAVIDLERLRHEVRSLQLDCQRMNQELDIHNARKSSTSSSISSTPGAPTTANSPQSPQLPPLAVEDEDESVGGWNCIGCTFYNHPALEKCEECETPRLCRPIITSSQGVMGIRSFIPYSRPGNIHIHVRHRPRTIQGWGV